MTTAEFLEKVQEIAQTHPRYRLGGDGRDGTCDCIGLVIGALKKCGYCWQGIHGSNWAARYAMKEMIAVSDKEDLVLGNLVYKVRRPGHTNYALPSRYASDPDRNDYYHVGVVTSTEPLEITHCSTGGIARDRKLGAWCYRGRLACMEGNGTEASNDYKTQNRKELQKLLVFAANGSPVKLRSRPSTSCREWILVPCGEEVLLLDNGAAGSLANNLKNGTENKQDDVSDWAHVQYRGRKGYMMQKFLKEVDSDGESMG